MTTTPDPETTWLAEYFPAITLPAAEISVKAVTGEFSYGAGIYQYSSVLGVYRGVYVNPTAFIGMSGVQSKWVSSLASVAGNYYVQITDLTNITLGNELSLQRSGIHYSSNREYKLSTQAVAWALLVVLVLADLAVIFTLRFSSKTDTSAAKIAVGISQAVLSATIVVQHYLESYGVEMVPNLSTLANTLKVITERIAYQGRIISMPLDALNPLLTKIRLANLKRITETASDNSDKVIKMAKSP